MSRELNPDIFFKKPKIEPFGKFTDESDLLRRVNSFESFMEGVVTRVQSLELKIEQLSKTLTAKVDRVPPIISQMQSLVHSTQSDVGEKLALVQSRLSERRISEARVEANLESTRNTVASLETRLQHMQRALLEVDRVVKRVTAELNLARLSRQ